MASNMISSFLKSVFLYVTFAPLDKVNVVAPILSLVSFLAMLPSFTVFLIKLEATALSSYGFKSFELTFKASKTSASVTFFKPSFSGEVITITLLSSLIKSFIKPLTCVKLIVGKIF